MSDDLEYGLIVSFPDESESFVHGFEAGEIWRDIESEKPIDRVVHSANIKVITRMVLACGYDCEFAATEFAEWVHLQATKTGPGPKNANPNGLRVVK